MSDERIKLRVLGISYSQIQTGAYALILAQVDGPYRIPIVIGASEAQSIAIKLEGIIPPRPMTHDLFVSFAHAFGVKLQEVFIYKFEDGIFSSEITFTDRERTIVLDARTSDAIAIAIRTKAPIYTTRGILDETGFIIEETPGDDDDEKPRSHGENDTTDEPKLENYAIEELERELEKMIALENYEEAARISEILKRKRGENM